MPIYPYQCRNCGHTWDHLDLSGGEEEACETCPSCEATTITRLVTIPALKFKGEGWETNDHKVARMKKDPKAHDPMDLVDMNDNPVDINGERV